MRQTQLQLLPSSSQWNIIALSVKLMITCVLRWFLLLVEISFYLAQIVKIFNVNDFFLDSSLLSFWKKKKSAFFLAVLALFYCIYLFHNSVSMLFTDFGLSNCAGILGYSDPFSTQCGSPAYAAPELLARKKYGPKIDVWSMWVTSLAYNCCYLSSLPIAQMRNKQENLFN